MNFLWTSLVALAIVTMVQPLIYMFGERWYRKNPEAEKEKSFEMLEAFFSRKYMKFGFLAASVIFWIAAAIVFKMYISPTL
ncbi:MAG: hypothetical protein NC395_04585 [Prevotella sp.]|nr:hypothetical protein [Prevotella sp.]